MLTRQINGVRLAVISPSFYTVDGYPIEISYVGDHWQLWCPDDSSGEPIYSEFPSLAAAVAPIAQAWKNVGLL